MGYTEMLRDGSSTTEMREYLVGGETTAVTIRIPRNLRDSAKKAAELRGTSFSALIRECLIDEFNPKKGAIAMSVQVKSKERVQEHGEVFTNPREVNAMLDMVKEETERIESRFLEPACGDGNFLAEVLRRKLAVVAKRYRKSPLEYERYAFLAVSSLYGVDILSDNVEECHTRLFAIVEDEARRNLKTAVEQRFLEAVRYILEKNIVCGDALTLKSNDGEPITFSEWSLVSGDKVKRRDYLLSELLDGHVGEGETLSMFGARGDIVDWEFDEETQAYLPSAIREYPLMNYWKVVCND